MSTERLAEGPPLEARIEGTVTFVNTATFGTFGFLQDGQHAIYMTLDPGLEEPIVGRRVRVRATVHPGEFAPSLQVHDWSDRGPGAPPEPATDLAEDNAGEDYDCRWVSTDGVVRRMSFDEGSHLFVLWLGSDANALTVELPGALPADEVADLVGARIEAEGAAAARFNARRQLIGPRVLVPELANIRILEAPVADPTRLPVVSTEGLLQYGLPSGPGGLVRIRGVVTFRSAGLLVVQDAVGATSVRLADGGVPTLGSEVDLVGYAEPDTLVPGLVDAILLAESPGRLPTPTSASDLGEPGLAYRRVRLRGEVLRASDRAEQAVLVLAMGDRVVEAIVASEEALPDAVLPGATVAVTGVVRQRTDPMRPRRVAPDRYALVADEAQVLVSSVRDVEVIRAAPYWTPLRALLLVGVLLVALGLFLGLVLALRYQVHRQTRQIRRQLTTQADLRAQAQEASVAKGRFLATMSHELRTPLHGILGTLSLLRDSPRLSPEDRELVEVIHTSGNHLSRLVGDVLDLSKAEAGQLQVEHRTCAPRAVLGSCVDEVRDLAAASGLTVELTVDASVPEAVLTDEVRLRQVVSNLLTNAVRFTQEGGVHVHAESPRADALVVRVRDTGVGMSAEVQERLFQPFQQADASTSRTHGGTGLGLAICRELCQLLGGEITVRSEPGEGSEFIVRVAAPAVTPETSDTTVPSDPVEQLDLSGVRVLVADDNAVNRTIVERMLERLGARVDLACDGVEAVEQATTDDHDLVLLDLHMPRLSGLDAARQIRSALGQDCPPMMALTADALASTRQACARAGLCAVLTKPMTLDELKASLARRDLGSQARSSAPR